jgi:hypothetical protein
LFIFLSSSFSAPLGPGQAAEPPGALPPGPVFFSLSILDQSAMRTPLKRKKEDYKIRCS